MRDTLYRGQLLQSLREIHLELNPFVTARAEHLVAGLLYRAIELLPLPDDLDILPDVPHIVQAALQLQRSTPDAMYQDMLRQLEHETGCTLPNFQALTDGEKACHDMLELIYRAVYAATNNDAVAADVRGVLRAYRSMAEYHATTFCYSTVGAEVLRMTTGSQHGGVFGDVVLRTSRDGRDVIISLSASDEQDFVFYWSGAGCTLQFVQGDMPLALIEQMFATLYRTWRAVAFLEV